MKILLKLLLFAVLTVSPAFSLAAMTSTGSFETARKVAEFASWLVLIATGPAIFIQLRQHRLDAADDAKKERVEVAEKSYLEVDIRFGQLLQLCIERPRLDCYSLPLASPCDPPLNNEELTQQKLLYCAFTNMFEVAYFEYKKKEGIPTDVKARFERQWSGWENYICKFHRRAAYRQVWSEIMDEYDQDFVEYIQGLVTPAVKP